MRALLAADPPSEPPRAALRWNDVTVEPDVELVRALLREQFPRWGDEVISPVPHQGWDNRTFRIGEHLAARLPSAQGYAAAVAKEWRWLPWLAPRLPQATPSPVERGHPGCGYPWEWSIYEWIAGEPVRLDELDDVEGLAEDVGGFLAALHRVDTSDGPAAGEHSGWRGGPLSHYDQDTRSTIDLLGRSIDGAAALRTWEAALAAPPSRRVRWVHGDLAASNLLVRDAGRLVAVIDFGCCAVGDPACDLVPAWTMFSGPSRAAFERTLGVDESDWERARGWALWKALLTRAESADGTAERRYGWRCSAADLLIELIAPAS